MVKIPQRKEALTRATTQAILRYTRHQRPNQRGHGLCGFVFDATEKGKRDGKQSGGLEEQEDERGEGCGRILEGGGAVYDLALVIMTLVLMKVHRTKHK